VIGGSVNKGKDMDTGYVPHPESGIQSIDAVDNAVDQMMYSSEGMSETSDISYVLPYLYDEQIIDNGDIFSQLAYMSPQPLNPTTVHTLFFPPLQLNLSVIATRHFTFIFSRG
jgi:hypothetical protein